MIRRTLVFFCLFAALMLPSAAAAFELQGIHINAGNAITINAEPVDVSPAPSPASPMFGVSVPMKFTDIFYFEPGLRLYSTSVVLTSEYKAVPAAIETADRVSVLNLEIRPETGAIFDIGEKISLGVTGAPVLTFRIPVNAYDDAVEADHKTIVRDYYYSMARFLGFYAGGFFSWNITENTAFRVKAGTNLPVYHIWDGDDAGFHDQLIIEPELGIVFRF